MKARFGLYLEVKAELDSGRISRRQIPGGVEWFDADEAEYKALKKSKSPVQKKPE